MKNVTGRPRRSWVCKVISKWVSWLQKFPFWGKGSTVGNKIIVWTRTPSSVIIKRPKFIFQKTSRNWSLLTTNQSSRENTFWRLIQQTYKGSRKSGTRKGYNRSTKPLHQVVAANSVRLKVSYLVVFHHVFGCLGSICCRYSQRIT